MFLSQLPPCVLVRIRIPSFDSFAFCSIDDSLSLGFSFSHDFFLPIHDLHFSAKSGNRTDRRGSRNGSLLECFGWSIYIYEYSVSSRIRSSMLCTALPVFCGIRRFSGLLFTLLVDFIWNFLMNPVSCEKETKPNEVSENQNELKNLLKKHPSTLPGKKLLTKNMNMSRTQKIS